MFLCLFKIEEGEIIEEVKKAESEAKEKDLAVQDVGQVEVKPSNWPKWDDANQRPSKMVCVG